MTMRAGSHNAAKPIWRGVIREDSYPRYVCIHSNHNSQPEATECARAALTVIRATSGPLPHGWITYQPPTAI